jgi:hypothetical protein
MALLTDMEMVKMAKSELAVTPNPACRIIELIPLSEQEKYKGSKSSINDAIKALKQFCKVAKRPGNIKYQGPSIMKYIQTLRQGGLGKYFYERDSAQAKAEANKAAEQVAAAAKVAENIPEPAVVQAVNTAVEAVNKLATNTSTPETNITTNTKIANASEEAKNAVTNAIQVTNSNMSKRISNLNTKLNRVLEILEKIQPSAPAAGGRRKTRKYKLTKRKHTRKHI